MKNKLVNKKVVSSIGIGIMAFVTATSPALTVLAEDGDTSTDPVPEVVEQPSQPAEQSEPQNAEVSDAISGDDGAQKAIETAQTTINDQKKTVNDPSVQNNLEEANSALDSLKGEITELDDLNKKAIDKKGDWQESLESATNGDQNGWLDNFSSDAFAAETAGSELKESINDEKAAITEEKAAETENAQKVIYENAEAAQAAKNQANTAATEAEAIRDQAQKVYDEAEEKLKIAEQDQEVAEELWKKASNNYQDAVNAVKDAKDALEKLFRENGIDEGDLEDDTLDASKFDKNVKTALEKAQAALAQAEIDKNKAQTELENAITVKKTAQDVLNKAQEEMTVVLQDLNKLEDAERALTDAREKEAEWQATSNTLNNASSELKNAEDTRDRAKEDVNTAIETLKNAQQELLAGEAKEQKFISETANKTYKEAQDAVNQVYWVDADKKKQEAWEKEKQAREELVSSMNKQAETQIKYYLQKNDMIDDVDDIVFSNWVSARGDNNYVFVSYKDKTGETHVEYYDYSENGNGGITVLKKDMPNEGSYLNSDGISLAIKKNDVGEQQFLMGGKELSDDVRVEGTPESGYTVTIPSSEIREKETIVCHPGVPRALVDIKLTKVTLQDGTIVHFMDEKEVKVEYGPQGVLVKKIGDITIETQSTWRSQEKSDISIFFGPVFDSKGKDCGIAMPDINKSLDDLRETADTAKEDKIEKDVALNTAETEVSDKKTAFDTALNDAKTKLENAEVNIAGSTDEERKTAITNAVTTQLENAETDRVEAEKVVSDIEKPYKEKAEAEKKKVKDFLDELRKGWPEREQALQEALTAAGNQENIKNSVKTAADKVWDSVGNANQKVMDAAKKLAELSAQTNVSEEEYMAAKKLYDNAVADCVKAAEAKGASEENLKRIVEAAQRARAAADAQFAYNTPTPGGTNPGGTTGGGAGGTTGGGTGGGTAGTAAPAAAPVVTVPTTAVPLAGPAIVDGDENQNTGDLTTLEDETTPLAGPEEKEGALNLTDFPMPSAGPVAEMGQMSWWWLLIVALLGVTGEEMYRRHQKKQREEANIEN